MYLHNIIIKLYNIKYCDVMYVILNCFNCNNNLLLYCNVYNVKFLEILSHTLQH